ncbi:PHP domain-containing protein, partial [Clavibacter michiganensis]|uniref:PHP domain-containing protein n=1 Tax=Clavibacter michiganensis TaxID=28447 RepID=UPI00292DCB06
MSFTHLHVASAFSAHFGTSAPEALVDRVASEGAPAAAITDLSALTHADVVSGTKGYQLAVRFGYEGLEVGR